MNCDTDDEWARYVSPVPGAYKPQQSDEAFTAFLRGLDAGRVQLDRASGMSPEELRMLWHTEAV